MSVAALVTSASIVASAGSAVASSSVGASAGSVVTSGATLGAVIATAVPSIVASVLPSAVTTTQPVTAAAIHVPVPLEVGSAFAGALAGGLAGVRLKFDAVGIATLAVVSGLGGGIIRDVLLQKYGVYALQNPRLLVAALIAALISFFFFSLAERLKWVLFVVDAVALGLFASLGCDKALLAGLTWVPAILLGTITAVGGGVLRDVLTDDVPQVLRPGGFYATVAVAGAVMYVGLVGWLNVVKPVAVLVVVAVVTGLRFLTNWLGWQTPTATDLTPLVADAPRRMVQTGGRAMSWAIRRPRGPGSGVGEPPAAPLVEPDAGSPKEDGGDEKE